jgi:hypothetical protein
LSAHAKAEQQQRELVCSHQSSAAAEGACLLIPKQSSSTGSVSVDFKAVQQQKQLVDVVAVQQQKEPVCSTTFVVC